MILRQFDLNLLIIFEALISECHVSRAADKVFLSQSAMSHALNRLREQLNDPILVRTESGLQPTPRAKALAPKVRNALQLLQQSLLPPDDFDAARSERTFTIASTDYFEAVIFPDLLNHLLTIAPSIKIEIEMIREESSHKRLANGEVDLVVGLNSQQPLPSHLIVHPWLTETQMCLVASDHPHIKNSLTLKQYVKLPHVVFMDVSQDGQAKNIDAVDQWLASKQLSRQHMARTVNYMAAARIVEKNHAVMTLPFHMAQLFSQMLKLRMVKPPKGIPSINMTLVQHPLYSEEPSVSWLTKHIQTFSQNLSWKA
ncbi:LysR family transcriptional regulator [Oceaniserpentilla sp. 4NH20-0058]|uniref:LysR family transcriptional regulator n=1 Tax=Oceaniserpentilla sp. 4NH20-0058 TaxID=3127660 RepID=UPI00310A8957